MSFLDASRQLWDAHAQRDPLWAILSDPSKKGGQWDTGRFFQTGVGEIALLLYQLHALGIDFRRGSALDFGCGVGRLTQALARHVDRVVGVDVSPQMVELAARLNQWPRKAFYVSNQAPDLRLFDDRAFDLIVSNIVLQHIRPDIAVQYVGEFLRVLARGGVLVFQLPSHERGEADEPPPPPVRAMPDEAYAAAVVVARVPAGELPPGSQTTIDVEVTNRSGFEWSVHAFGAIRVGNHWRDAAGEMAVRDDGRSSLPETVQSGATCTVPLTFTAPGTEGKYLCEIDLAHEGVLWFCDKGSPVFQFAVTVRHADACRPAVEATPAPGSAASPRVKPTGGPAALPTLGVGDRTAEDPGAFPMFGVPTALVRRVIAGHGGELLHVEDDRSCGDDWVSYRYFVRKPFKPL